MIRSMTGFGHAGSTVDGFTLQIDIKSVNHRYQETLVRLPREWMKLEDKLRKLVAAQIRRGRVEMFVSIEKGSATEDTFALNWALIDQLVAAAEQLKTRYALTQRISIHDIIQYPDVMLERKLLPEEEQRIAEQMLSCAEEALQQLLHMREIEGENLRSDLRKRWQTMAGYQLAVQQQAPLLKEQLYKKLKERLHDLLGDSSLDEQRLTMEAALLAERADIEEELTRLSSHLSQGEQLLDSSGPVGRKLDFLIQEMNREVNTIGSKASQADIIQLVVQMKSELEKIREQVQNVE